VRCLVDAGALVRVTGVTPRDCALLAIVAAEGRARFPIVMYEQATGQVYRFTEKEERPNEEPSSFSTKRKPAAR
jgi:hypothetical protein